jgi:hypothetical protein
MAGTAVRAAAGGCDNATWQRSPRLLGEYSKRRVAALVEMTWMVTEGGFMPETSSFPIFLRATLPQVQSPDIGEGLGCGRFSVYLATRCVVLESKADMQKRG